MGLMILGFPIPGMPWCGCFFVKLNNFTGKITALMHKVQAERMKQTDERVQSVTESESLLR